MQAAKVQHEGSENGTIRNEQIIGERKMVEYDVTLENTTIRWKPARNQKFSLDRFRPLNYLYARNQQRHTIWFSLHVRSGFWQAISPNNCFYFKISRFKRSIFTFLTFIIVFGLKLLSFNVSYFIVMHNIVFILKYVISKGQSYNLIFFTFIF